MNATISHNDKHTTIIFDPNIKNVKKTSNTCTLSSLRNTLVQEKIKKSPTYHLSITTLYHISVKYEIHLSQGWRTFFIGRVKK